MTRRTHHLLPQIDPLLVVVRRVQRRDPPNALGPEPRPGAVGAPSVKRHAHHGAIVRADGLGILDVGRLEKSVDAGKVGQLPPRKGGNGLVVDGRRAGQTELEALGDFLVEFRQGEVRLLEGGLPSLGVLGVERVGMVVSPLRPAGVDRGEDGSSGVGAVEEPPREGEAALMGGGEGHDF